MNVASWGEFFGYLERASFVSHVEAVPRLDLDGGGSGPVSLGESQLDESLQLGGAGGPGRLGSDPDAAAVVGLAGHAAGELLGAVAGENQVRVRVDEAGENARTLSVDSFVGYLARRAYGLYSIIRDDN